MIAALVALIAIIFLGGGYETVLLNPDMKKNIHEYVQDKEHVKQIDALIKEIGSSQKTFMKKIHKPDFKSFNALNLDYNSTRESYTDLLNKYFTAVEALQNNYIQSELKMRELITETEWNNIMGALLTEPDKEKDKKQADKMVEQMHRSMLKACEKEISDTNNLDKARLILNEYKAHTEELVNTLLARGYKNRKTIRQYNASKGDFEEFKLELLDQRREYANFIIDMQFQLKKLTEETEWGKLAKELNDVLNKASGE